MQVGLWLPWRVLLEWDRRVPKYTYSERFGLMTFITLDGFPALPKGVYYLTLPYLRIAQDTQEGPPRWN